MTKQDPKTIKTRIVNTSFGRIEQKEGQTLEDAKREAFEKWRRGE